MNGDQEEEEEEDEEELMDDAGSLLKGSCQAVFLKLPYVFFIVYEKDKISEKTFEKNKLYFVLTSYTDF